MRHLTGADLLLALGVLAVSTLAQAAELAGGTITGRVTAQVNGSPLSGVAIVLESGLWSSYISTDAAGVFTFSGLAPGTYYARAQAPSGYLSQIFGGSKCGAVCPPITEGTPIAVAEGTTRSGIDFELVRGGVITGRVLDANDAKPLAGIGVTVYSAQSQWAAYALTDNMGVYWTPEPLTSGIHFAWVWEGSRHFGQLYDGIDCVPSCMPGSGTAIPVTEATTTSGVNFSLAPAGSISGRVTDGTTPLAGASVSVYTSSAYITTVTTGSDGRWATNRPLQSGVYFLEGYLPGYARQVYRGTSCVPSCPEVTSGTPVSVTKGAATENVDFSLEAYPVVTGMVTGFGGTPLSGVEVRVVSPTGTVAVALTDASGSYRTTVTWGAGTAYAIALGRDGYYSQLYKGIDCATNCPGGPTGGTPFSLALGATTAAIDFSLVRAPSVSGTVTARSGGVPVAGATVTLWSSSGALEESMTTGTDGKYLSSRLLAAGSYYVSASASGYLGQVYSGVDCPGLCSEPTSGTPIALSAGVSRPDIDFALAAGGVITGTVRYASNGAPVVGTDVYAVTLSGSSGGVAKTDATGFYRMSALSTGSYRVYVNGYSDTLGQVYGGPDCAGYCEVPTAGTPVAATAGSTTEGIDFSLFKSGVISGRVTRAVDGAGVQGASVSIHASNGSALGFVQTDANGLYTTSGAMTLASGTYYAKATSDGPFVPQIYQGMDCGMPCPNPGTGTGVAVTRATTTSGIDFALARGGAIAGMVTARGKPLSGVTVWVYTATDGVTWAATDPNGAFKTEDRLPTGPYYVQAMSPPGHFDQIYQGINCAHGSCPLPSTGIPVAVTQGATTGAIDFALVAPGWISGIVTAAGGGPIAGANVLIRTSNGSDAARLTTDATGAYITPATLVPGNYYAMAWGTGYVPQVYSGVACASRCPEPPGGDPVPVVDGQETSGISFSLSAGGSISGKVTAGGLPLAGVEIQVFGADATWAAYAYTDSEGRYATPGSLNAGSYYVVARESALGYLSQIYGGVNCSFGSCPPATTGTPVTVTLGSITPGIDFALTKGGSITGTVKAAAGGGPVATAAVSIYDASGTRLWRGYSGGDGRYSSLYPLTSGSYYLAVSPLYPYRGQIYRDVNCTRPVVGGGNYGCPPVTIGTPVSVTAGSTTASIDFELVSWDSPAFTDDPIIPGTTRVMGVHVTELRQAIDTLRLRSGLPGASWTDAALTPGVTLVKAIHLQQLRSALEAVYSHMGRSLPASWAPDTIVPSNTTVTAATLMQLRVAVSAIW